MKTILIIITLIIATTGWTQNVTQPITDTSMVVGVVKEDCLGKILDYCSVSTDKEFKKGTTVIVCGIQECKKNYSNVIIINKDVVQYYEICRNKQTYYIERDKLATMPNVYEEIALLSSDHADTFKKNAQNTAELIYKSELRKALNFLSACKPKGLVITKWSLYDVSEYTEGTGLRISVYNPTQKTIKYLWITVTGFNPVDDKVVDRHRGTSNITVKAVGPIEPDHTSSFEFDYVWFTDLVETGQINSIKVQYMDGSLKMIGNPKQIEMGKYLYDIIYEED